MSNALLRYTLATTLAVASVGAATVARAQVPEGPVPLEDILTGGQFDLFNDAVNEERLQLEGITQQSLDPESLRFINGIDPVDVFFINEGATFRSTLQISINGSSLIDVFDDIASPDSIIPEANGPLSLGEGIRIGSFAGNTTLEFFLDTNRQLASNPSIDLVYGADAASNPDGLQHVVAEEFTVDGETFVLIGFEDLFGTLNATGGDNENSDRDFNDVVFAVRGIEGDPLIVQPPGPSIPEPTSAIALLGIAALGATKLRRQKS